MKKIAIAVAVAVATTVMTVAPVKIDGINNQDDGEPFSTRTIDIFNGELILAKSNPKPYEFKIGESKDTKEKREAAEAKAKQKITYSPSFSDDSSAKKIGTDENYRDEKGRSNCVTFATKYTGIHKPLGWGVTIPAEGYEPEVGAIGLEKFRGHAVVIMSVEGEYLTVWDTNWVKGYITERRVHRSQFRGYIYKS